MQLKLFLFCFLKLLVIHSLIFTLDQVRPALIFFLEKSLVESWKKVWRKSLEKIRKKKLQKLTFQLFCNFSRFLKLRSTMPPRSFSRLFIRIRFN